MAPRLPLLTDRRLDIGLADASGLHPGLDALRRRVPTGVPARHLHPVTAELVRMRNARRQGCNLCQSLRYQSAVHAGATDEVLADRYPGRTAHDAAALRLADAYLGDPTELDDTTRSEILDELTPAEVAEVVGRLANWTFNKVLISLGLDVDRIERRVYPDPPA